MYSDCVKAQISERDVWKLNFSTQNGALSVMTTLISMMPVLSASFWDSLGPLQHIVVHTLEKEVALSRLIIFTVLAVKTGSRAGAAASAVLCGFPISRLKEGEDLAFLGARASRPHSRAGARSALVITSPINGL